MRRFPLLKYLLLPLLLLAACTEEIDIRSRSDYHDYLAVEAVLTDNPDEMQCVVLSRSVSLFEEEFDSAVDGARVSVNDIPFTNYGGGSYFAPDGFCCEAGQDYELRIELEDGQVYEASASMPEPGFRMDAIDYAFSGNKALGIDSLWTVKLWGKDEVVNSYYQFSVAVNGFWYPFNASLIMDDKLFNGNDVSGFPIATLSQTDQLYRKYGPCFKYLETGDEITLNILTLDKGYYDFLSALRMSGVTIPIFSPQPANVPTNIRGEHALGWFAVCPSRSARVEVDDPFR
ncbi:MAG: DUF4249 domain-containing protein [Bacteroidales bacterium]|nr:DUF4249 domain-containing protein [Bacteroidales bacterium]